MANQGRPIISQDAPPTPKKEPTREEVRIRNLYRKLMHSGYAENPFIENQEQLLPDTVKVVARTALVLDLSDEQQLKRYGELLTSTQNQGREVITFEEMKSFDNIQGWKVILKINVRAFRCLTNYQESRLLTEAIIEDTTPIEDDIPEEDEAEEEAEDLQEELDLRLPEGQDAVEPIPAGEATEPQ